MKPRVRIDTDGACKGNPGPGGWGAVIEFEDGSKTELSGYEPKTTNNRMELVAVITALNHLSCPCAVDVYCDSRYVTDSASKWLRGWVKNKRDDLSNMDLWMKILAAMDLHDITWIWVRGHSGDVKNERCDALANAAIAAHAEVAKPKWYALDYESVAEELYRELDRVQDRVPGTAVAFKAESLDDAGLRVAKSLIPFFKSKLQELY